VKSVLLFLAILSCMVLAACSASPTPDLEATIQARVAATQAAPVLEATKAAQPTNTATLEPADTPVPPTPAEAEVLEATATPPESVRPVTLRGTGRTATDPIALPASVSVAEFTHDGESNFSVWVYRGTDEHLLINTIGPYKGRLPLFGEEQVVFDIDADGRWTVKIEPIGSQASPSFSGRGDDVSDLFDPPQMLTYEISHDGESNFAVWLHCAGGSDLIENEIGPVSGSAIVKFEEAPCLWEVTADGDWGLIPRQ